MKLAIYGICRQVLIGVYTQDVDMFNWKDVLRLCCVIATFVITVWLITNWQTLDWIESAGYVSILCGTWFLSIFTPSIKVTAFGLMFLTYIWGVHNIVFNGVNGEYDAILTFCIIIAGYVYGQKIGFATTLLTTATVFLFSHLVTQYPQSFPAPFPSANMSIVSHTTAFFALGLGYLCVALLVRHLKFALEEKSVLAAELAKTTSQLQNALERESELAHSLRLLLDQEQKKNHSQQKLLKEVSHKCRNPLTVISLHSNALKRRAEKLSVAKRERYYREIQSSVDRMVTVIDTLENPAENNSLM